MAKKGYIYRTAQTRGLLGGSRNWTILWALLMGRRVLKRVTAKKPEVVYRSVLKPGEAVVIRHGERPPGREVVVDQH